MYIVCLLKEIDMLKLNAIFHSAKDKRSRLSLGLNRLQFKMEIMRMVMKQRSMCICKVPQKKSLENALTPMI